MCKLDLRDAYFTIRINQKYRKYLRFKWEGTLYQFLCLCFGLGQAPLIFTKLMKVPISLLWRLNICLIIYLDNMLIMARSVQELIFHRDTVIYLLHNLRFVLNLKNSVLGPSQNHFGNGYRLNEDGNLIASKEACKTNVTMQTNSREQRDYHHGLNKVNRETGINSPAILLAQLQVQHLQRLQIQALKLSKCYHAKVHLDKDAKDEFFWWIENLRLCNGKSLILPPADFCISTDASTKGWEATCQRISTCHRKNRKLTSTY